MIEPAKQARDCLTTQHVVCPRYHPPVTPPSHGQLLTGSPTGAERETVNTIAGSGRATAVRRRPSARRAAMIAVLVLVLIGGAVAVMVGVWMAERSRASGPVASNGGIAQQQIVAIVPATPSGSVRPTATPITATPFRTAVTTLEPILRPTASPTPPPLVHVVKRGETLSSIARLYRVSIAALKRANILRDPNLITVGQRLVIPVG